MVSEPSRYPLPFRRNMLLSLGVRCFRNPWMLKIRCSYGREVEIPLPALVKVEFGGPRRLSWRRRCQNCGSIHHLLLQQTRPDPTSDASPAP